MTPIDETLDAAVLEVVRQSRKLNEAQIRASRPEGFVLSSAGAGTGKTTLLAARYLRLLAQAAKTQSPAEAIRSIAAMTFTEKAAGEMTDRIRADLLSLSDGLGEGRWFSLYRLLDSARVSTIHSFCLELLRRYPLEAGLDPGFSVNPLAAPVDEYVNDFLNHLAADPEGSELLLSTIKLMSRRALREALAELYRKRPLVHRRAKELAESDPERIAGIWMDELKRNPRTKRAEDEDQRALALARATVGLARLYLRLDEFIWQGYDRAANIDFADILLRFRDLLQRLESSALAAELPKHILVDEFQDTSPLQWEIIRSLAERAQSALFVGDEKQSIYMFRGADVTVVRRGEEFVKSRGGKPVPLKTNYRTKKRLLELLNKIFSHDKNFGSAQRDFEARPQPLVSGAGDGGELWLVEVEIPESGQQKAPKWQYVVEATCRFVRAATCGELAGCKRIPAGEILVLARKRNEVFEIVRMLREGGVRAIPLAESGLFETTEVKTLLCLLEFLDDPRRNGALAFVLTSRAFGVSEDELAAVSEAPGATLWEKLCAICQNKTDEGRPCRAFLVIDDLISRREEPADRLLERFLGSSDIFPALCGGDYDVAPGNMLRFLGIVRRLVRGEGANLHDLVRALRAMAEENAVGLAPPKQAADFVRVSTIHSAKGLQADTVVVVDPLERVGSRDRIILADLPLEGAGETTWQGFIPKLSGTRKPKIQEEILKKSETPKREAEYTRLMYVAFTRAKERLVLVGAKEGSKLGNSFFSKTFAALADLLDGDPPEGVVYIKASEITAPPPEERQPKPRRAAGKDLSEPILWGAPKTQSVTDFVESEMLPTRGKAAQPSGIGFGQLVHKLLSFAPFESASEAKRTAERIAPGEPRLSKLAATFAESEFNKILLRHKGRILKEVPIWFREGEDLLLYGVVDVVLPDIPAVCDYKTGAPRPSDKRQIELYRRGVAKSLGIAEDEVKAWIVRVSEEKVVHEEV